ncbi:serine hydrolase domain-containing protein [Streptomyces klenkii]|uniref:serine hydrolase domain-containing protein n=1 Tax=Streptomyces klenkii TaxID=1420899 RepID=UPI0034261A7A
MLISLITATVTVTTLSTSSAAGTETAPRETLQGQVEALHRLGVVGVQAEAVENGKHTRVRAGYAQRGSFDSVPDQGYFRMGSNTKTFVATVMLQLAGEGLVKLDDSVEHLLPNVVRGNGNDGRKITVRHLLQHTSGLPSYTDYMPQLRSEEDFAATRLTTYQPIALVKKAMEHPPGKYAPGTRWAYSNTNYILAAMIIKKVTGHTWDQEVHKRVTRPLGLSHTYSPGADPTLPAPHAHSYYQFSDGGRLIDTTENNMSWGGSAGDLITTPADLAAFWQGLLGGRLLKPAQLKLMKTTVPISDGLEMGLGIFKTTLSCGGSYWGHGGDTTGFHTANGFSEDGRRGLVISMNSGPQSDTVLNATNKAIDHIICGTP